MNGPRPRKNELIMMPLLHFGPFWLPAYGFMMSIAVLTGVKLAVGRAPRHGLEPQFIYFAGSLAALTALVMAKLLDWAIHPLSYWSSPGTLVTGAGTFLFGFICAFFVMVFLAVRRSVSLWAMVDSFAPSLALGVCLVRIGCFLSGCDYGKPTNLPWGVVFSNPLAAQLAGTPLGIRLHPSQLYESLLGLSIFLAIALLSRHERRPGTLILTFALCYSGGRFFLEFFRGDLNRLFFGPFSTSQWLSLLAAFSFLILYFLPMTHARTPLKVSWAESGTRRADGDALTSKVF
jgi:phosphatidylglycerol:prolipoprotein diacylglycerol transferase